MRELDSKEITIVAGGLHADERFLFQQRFGGFGAEEDERRMPVVQVTTHRRRPRRTIYIPPSPVPALLLGPIVNAQFEPTANDEEEHEDLCRYLQENSQPDVDMDALRDVAQGLSEQLLSLRQADGAEHAFLIFRGAAGNLIVSPSISSGNSDDIEFSDFRAVLDIYDNAPVTLVGWIHAQSGPIPSDSQAALGNGNDWQWVQDMINGSTTSSVDPNLTTFIVDQHGNLHEYQHNEDGTFRETNGDETCEE